jgi:hypothetical protein
MHRRDATKTVPDTRAARERVRTAEAASAEAQGAGWDPFEIWRERIQRPRELAGKTTPSELDRARQKS